MDQEPAVGEIVHYTSYGTPGGEYTSQCRAALVAGVPRSLTEEPWDGCPNGTDGRWLADLVVVNPTGLFFNQAASLDQEEQSGGSWHRMNDPAFPCRN